MSIQEQLNWEKECIERGTARYYATQDRMRESGQGDQTDAVSYVLKDRLFEVAEKIKLQANVTKGKGGKYNKLLRNSALDEDYLRVAYIGTKVAFQTLMQPKQNTLLKVCLDIASRLEADLKCQLFEAEHPAYYGTVNKSFKDQKVLDYTHKHKVLMKKFNEFGFNWNDWTGVQKTHVGSKVLRCILETFWDVLFINKVWSRGRTTNKLDTTPLFDTWAAEFEKERGFMYPAWLPLKCPPKAWEAGNKFGAYYSTNMCVNFPLIKTKGKDHKAYVEKANPQAHRDAVNKMQRTAWSINKEVLEVQKVIYDKSLSIGMPSSEQILPPEFPEHLKEVDKADLTDEQKLEVGDWKALAKRAYGKEQQRKGKVLAFLQAYKLANELQDWEKFYYAYNCDFRGRIYCATTGLSPQGADTAKGLLRFNKRVALGQTGVEWLAIHGANTYGVDKVSYSDRIAWINANKDNIERVADDPISAREWWGNADKPYQFLAFCFEWRNSLYGTDKNYRSSIPIGMDGSCNGLQHYSAMLRDEVGAKATNLYDGDTPNDIYGDVAKITTEKLRLRDDALARKWLVVGVDRKCAKRPVMTLPYGATQQSAKLYILEYVQEHWAKFDMDEKHQWEVASYLTPVLWAAIGETVVAAREAMSWLQKHTGGRYVEWLTPLGFPVHQYYKTAQVVKVKTQLNGTVEIKLRDFEDTGEPNRYGQRNGIAPNFVHSIDSTHMVMTINSTDLQAYAMIHDDFGTHAGNAHVLYKQIRRSFKQLYTKYTPLEDWATQQEIDLGTLPVQGIYDMEHITNASYFFG